MGRHFTGRPEHPSADQQGDPDEPFLPDEAAATEAPEQTAPEDEQPGATGQDATDRDGSGTGGSDRDETSRDEPGPDKPGRKQRGGEDAGPRRGPRSRRPIIVHAHISESAVAGAAGGESTTLFTVPSRGVISEEVFRRWCQTHDVRAARVIDLGRTEAVDGHDPPAWLADLVRERDRHCVFPHCQVDAADCDLDHIEAYAEDGPPGQTHQGNLACLCRRHHLVKTHAGWCYERAPDGTFVWTSPLAETYLVTADGRTFDTGHAA